MTPEMVNWLEANRKQTMQAVRDTGVGKAGPEKDLDSGRLPALQPPSVPEPA